jgi:tRNA (mo5U34)-methyltransferase
VISEPSQDAARAFIERTSFVWHQRWELAPGVVTPGTHDLGFLFDLSAVPMDLRGKSVLDVGTSNGGAAFILERRGAARVAAVDIYPPDWFGFEELRRFLGSSVEYVQATVYDLSAALGGETFDYVLLWGILYHLRHPLLALDAVREALAPGGLVDVETAVSDDEVGPLAKMPLARFFRGDELAADASNWFAPTTRCLHEWCMSSGLEPLRGHTWGEGAAKRSFLVARRTEGIPEYQTLSYEVALRAEPVRRGGPLAGTHATEIVT